VPREADADQGLAQQPRPESARQERKAQGAACRDDGGRRVHPSRVDAVGERPEKRRCDHVAAEHGSADQAGLGIVQAEFGHEHRQQRHEAGKRRHAQYLGAADRCDEASGGHARGRGQAGSLFWAGFRISQLSGDGASGDERLEIGLRPHIAQSVTGET
jgi:hypothetical protein